MSGTKFEEKSWSWFGVATTFCVPFFWQHIITIDDTNFRFKYGPVTVVSVKIELEQIDLEKLEIGNFSAGDNLKKFGGWGIRKNFYTGERGFNMHFSGPYIKIYTKDGKRKYHFGCKDAEAIKAEIIARVGDKK